MGKLLEFDITFANNKLVYNPGESISGTVKIKIGNLLHYKAVKVNCQGSCGVSNKLNEEDWAVEEQYFSSTLSVADKGSLARGDHSFPFQFLIPDTAPTSYEGPYGKITYRVRASIDTPRFSKDYKAQKSFYLLKPLNLNEVPDIEKPNSTTITKQFTYLLVKSGTLTLKAKTDQRGYIPGQVIKLSTEIHNKSSKRTDCVLASLIQKVTFKTKRVACDFRTIAEVEGVGVKGGKRAEWKEQIIVPPLPQSGLEGCTLISLDYFLKVSLKSPEVLVILPIHIGNIAFDPTIPRAPSQHPRPSGAPRMPPRPSPRRSTGPSASPSAPPAEESPGGAEGMAREAIPTKSHSQQDPFASPSARALTPGYLTAPTPPAGPQFSLSTGATIPFFFEGRAGPVPTPSPLVLPPDYSSQEYPHEPPPTYEESCSSTSRI
ncbi:hypothetical protein COCON_G00158470 [Conger conger]|uniref:Arrestin C-terminal-like domain-containing protein n=1 Tax=Conger conger TaxID=82655 RepID=A0A9Q1DA90_CONCO|nr:arrestin domain-containing protein 1a [Conger conger]KAJ8263390.1 hypothetical protein COCON_G00158470 [Conger conger]